MQYAIDRSLNEQEIRKLLEDRQEDNVVHLYRNMTTPGNSPGLLAWLQKERNPSSSIFKDTFAIYGGNYNGGSVDLDAAIAFVNLIGSSSYLYTGPKIELED